MKHKDLWLDIGAKDREEAAAAVQIGDPVTLELRLSGNAERPGQLAGHGQQDRPVGAHWKRCGVHRSAADSTSRCYAVSTVQEEIGLRGASPAPTASIRTSALPSTSRTRPIARRSTKRRKATSSSAADR